MLAPDQIAAVLFAQRLPLTAFVAAITRDFHLAEDIFQDVCVKAVSRDGEFDSPEHVVNWARVAGRNRAIDIVRARDGRYTGLTVELLDTLAMEWPRQSSRVPCWARAARRSCSPTPCRSTGLRPSRSCTRGSRMHRRCEPWACRPQRATNELRIPPGTGYLLVRTGVSNASDVPDHRTDAFGGQFVDDVRVVIGHRREINAP